MSSTRYAEPSRSASTVIGTVAAAMATGSLIHRRISWGAVLGGVVPVMAFQLLLSLLGAGIGLDTVDISAGTTPGAGSLAIGSLGIGVGVWWIVSSVVSLAFGSYVAAWLAGVELRWNGILHGLITWSIASLLTAYLFTPAVGSVVGGGASVSGGLASVAGGGLRNVAQPAARAAGIMPDVQQQQTQAYSRPTDPDPATMAPQNARKQEVATLATHAEGGPDADAAKDRIIAIIAAPQRIISNQAARQFDDAQARLQQQKDTAVQIARNTAHATATTVPHTSFASFADLLIGGIAVAIGGSLAVQRRARAAFRKTF